LLLLLLLFLFSAYRNSSNIMKSFTALSLFLCWSSALGQENSSPVAPSLAPTDSDTPTLVPTTRLAATPDKASPSTEPTASTQPTTSEATIPSKAPSKAASLFPSGTAHAESDQCADHVGCAALELTSACCPTGDDQYLDCCGGILPDDTCVQNARCAALGLVGTCCPTAGHRRPKFNGIYLDCCDTLPDACGPIANRSLRTGGGGGSNESTCVRQSAREFQSALAVESAAPRAEGWTVMMIALSVVWAAWG
jgi:hypothetical protein